MPKVIDLKEPKPGTSEYKVLEQLKTKISHRDWVIIHSLKSRYNTKNVEGEIDFVVFIPNKGMIIIEVKGADGFIVDKKGWTLKGVNKGQEHTDPFEQISSGEWAIRHSIRRLEIDDYGIPIARIVWFPKIEEDLTRIKENKTGLAFEKFELKYQNDLRNVERTLLSHIDQHLKLRKSSTTVHENGSNLTPQILNSLVSELVPAFEIPVSTEQLMKLRNKLVRKAEEEQLKIIDLVDGNNNLYFFGPAGSGKSQLLTKIAMDCAKAGHQVLLTCHQVMMADVLAQKVGQNPNITVKNLGDLMLEFAGKTKHRSTNPNQWYEKDLPSLALDALENKTARPKFSVVIVDEFQDIAANNLKTQFLKKVQAKVSHRKSRFIFAADDLQQVLSSNETVDSFDVAKQMAVELAVVKLNQNCRQMPALAKQVYLFLERPYPFKDEKIVGELEAGLEVIATSEDNQAKRLRVVLERLSKEYPPSNIRVLCFDNDSSVLGQIFKKTEIKDHNEKALSKMCKETVRNPDGPIKWRSIRKFKGLDEDAIVITDVSLKSQEYVLRETGKPLLDMLYVGMTRARFKVILLVQDDLFTPTHNADGSNFT